MGGCTKTNFLGRELRQTVASKQASGSIRCEVARKTLCEAGGVAGIARMVNSGDVWPSSVAREECEVFVASEGVAALASEGTCKQHRLSRRVPGCVSQPAGAGGRVDGWAGAGWLARAGWLGEKAGSKLVDLACPVVFFRSSPPPTP